MNYVLVPADKAANNVVVVWRLYYIDSLKCELVDTMAYKLQPSLSERIYVDQHGCHTALHLVSKLKKTKTKFLRCTGYLNSIQTYKARIIANSSSSKVLTSCHTAVKNT